MKLTKSGNRSWDYNGGDMPYLNSINNKLINFRALKNIFYQMEKDTVEIYRLTAVWDH